MVSERNIHRHVVLNVSVHFLQSCPPVWTKRSHIIIILPPFFSEHSILPPKEEEKKNENKFFPLFNVVTRVLTNAQHLELVSVQIDKTYVVKQ